MVDILKIVIMSIVCSVGVILLRQYRPELSLFGQIAGLSAVLIIGAATISGIVEYCRSILEDSIIDKGYLALLIKGLGIAIAAKFGEDLCRDSGNSALAFGVELVAKAAILMMTLPMLDKLADITSGLLKG